METWSYDDPTQRAAALKALLVVQDHRCAICGHQSGDTGRRMWPTTKLVKRRGSGDLLFALVEEEWPVDGHPVRLGVDHDHDSGLARGVLCTGCNRLVAWCENHECTCLWGYCPVKNYLDSPPARGGDPKLPLGGIWSHAMFVRPGDAILNGVGGGVWYANEVAEIRTSTIATDFYGDGPEVVAQVLPDLTFWSYHTALTPVIRDAASSRFVAGVQPFTQALRNAAAVRGDGPPKPPAVQGSPAVELVKYAKQLMDGIAS